METALALACAVAGVCWLGLALAAVVGRVGHDGRRRAAGSELEGRARRTRGLARRARRHATGTGKWRRIAALVELARRDPDRCRAPLVEAALADDDQDVRGAAVAALGLLARTREWALDRLVAVLADGAYPRSRTATQLEQLAPLPGPRLVELLEDERAPVRFWAVTLLRDYPRVATRRIVELAADEDPNVRASAVETLGRAGGRGALRAIVGRLADPVMYVRAHACRAAGELGGSRMAPLLVPLLGDESWWVRAAAKDALRALGPACVNAVLPALRSDDRFMRNGAAEILQDVGIVDRLLRERPDSELLEEILVAGEAGLREAAQERLELEPAAAPGTREAA